MAKLLRQRADDKGKWDVLEEGPDGLPRVDIVDTNRAYELTQKGGFRITDDAEWGKAADGMKGSSAPAPLDDTQVYALDDKDEPILLPRHRAERQGFRIVSEDEARKAGEALVAREDAELRARSTPAPVAARPAATTPRRPTVSVSTVGGKDEPSVRDFTSLAQLAPRVEGLSGGMPPEVAELLQRTAGSTTPGAQRTDSAAAARGGDAELRAAQERGDLLDFLARQGASFDDTARIIAGVGGSARPPPADLRDRPVQDLLRERASVQQQDTEKRKAAMRDPGSAESERARSLLRAAAPDLFTDEDLARLTAEDLESALDVSKLRAGLEERKAAREDSQAQREADRKSREQMAADARADRAAARADAREERALRREEMGARKEQDLAQKLAERNVGGYAFDPKNPPSSEAAKKFADVVMARDQVLGSLDKLEGLYDKHGSEMFGDEAGTMESAWMDITNKLRMVNDMGVPNGADYAMLAKQLQDPTSLQAMFRSTDRAKAQMAELRRQMAQKIDATAKALKFTPAGKEPSSSNKKPDQAPAPRAAPPPATTPGKVRVSNGKETLEIDASDLPEAKLDGFHEVK